jgi:hypothetical protein
MDDLLVLAQLADQLTALASLSAPAEARAIRKSIGYRLKRMKSVRSSD